MPPTTVSRNLAEQILESHGGELIISDLPQGRTLELRLPPMSIAADAAAHGAEAARRRSVLVVEDEPMGRCALEITLRPEHDVTAVTSGRSALDLLAQGEAFDVVLCDLPLPDMNGHTFYERLHTLRPEVAERVIIIARDPMSPHDSSFLQRMVGRRLDKPFTTDQLLSIVSTRAGVQNAAGGVP
jgi:CheY-like chemotaxis protein